MYRLIVILYLFFTTSMVYGVGTAYIDPEYKRGDMGRDETLSECKKKARNPIEKYACTETIIGNSSSGRSGPPPRGTQDYCDYKYKPMSFDHKKQILDTLRAQQPTARRQLEIRGGRLPGEVTQEHFQTEIVCVEAMLAGDQQDQIKSLRERFGLGRR